MAIKIESESSNTVRRLRLGGDAAQIIARALFTASYDAIREAHQNRDRGPFPRTEETELSDAWARAINNGGTEIVVDIPRGQG
jgi:hypothetical protein